MDFLVSLEISIVFYSIAILIELIAISLIIDMGRWNTSINLLFSMSVLDLLTFVFAILGFIFGYYSDLTEFRDDEVSALNVGLLMLFEGLEFAFLCWSLTASVIMSYNVYHLLKYSKIFDFTSSREKWVFYLILILPLGIILSAVLLTTIYKPNTYFLEYGSVSYTIYLFFDCLIFSLPSILVFANVVLFLLSRYHSNKILQPIQQMMASSSLSRPAHQTAIAVLVKRMRFYPIIQSVILVVLIVSFLLDTYSAVFCCVLVLIPLSALAYLVLFLKMQPFAFEHLKYRLGLGGKPANAFKAQSQNSSAKTSNTTSLLSTSIVESQYDTDLVDYDKMEDDELSSIVRNAPSIGGDNDIDNIASQSQL